MFDLPAPCSLPEYLTLPGTSEITPRPLGTGAPSTYTDATAPTPAKGRSVMVRVPGLPKDTSAAVTTLLRVSRSNTYSAHFVDTKDHNVGYYDYRDPIGSDNLDDNSCSNDNLKDRDSTSPDLFHALSKCALSTTHRPQPTSHHNLIYHPKRQRRPYRRTPPTQTRDTLSTTKTPLNPLSNLNNYRYACGGPGFGAGG